MINNYINENKKSKQKNNKTILAIVISILLLIILVLGIIKINTKEEKVDKVDKDNKQEKGVAVNTLYNPFYYYSFNVEDMPRSTKMHTAQKLIKESKSFVCEDKKDESTCYKAEDIKESYIKTFGPDSTYTDGEIKDHLNDCGLIGKYDEKTKNYSHPNKCRSDSSFRWETKDKQKETIIKDDFIYVYYYVKFILHDESTNKSYLFDRIVDETASDFDISKGVEVSSKDIDKDFLDLIPKGKVDLFKFTYKKQSDGNYYIQSGDWE